jgi:hypothetical protein
MKINDFHTHGLNLRVAQDLFHVPERVVDTVHAILTHHADDGYGTIRRLPDDESVTPESRTDIAGAQHARVFLHQVKDFRLAECVIAPCEYVDAGSAQFFKRGPGHAGPVRRVLRVGYDNSGLQLYLELWKQSPNNRTPRAAKDITDEQQSHEKPLLKTRTAKTLAPKGQRIWTD